MLPKILLLLVVHMYIGMVDMFLGMCYDMYACTLFTGKAFHSQRQLARWHASKLSQISLLYCRVWLQDSNNCELWVLISSAHNQKQSSSMGLTIAIIIRLTIWPQTTYPIKNKSTLIHYVTERTCTWQWWVCFQCSSGSWWPCPASQWGCQCLVPGGEATLSGGTESPQNHHS